MKFPAFFRVEATMSFSSMYLVLPGHVAAIRHYATFRATVGGDQFIFSSWINLVRGFIFFVDVCF